MRYTGKLNIALCGTVANFPLCSCIQAMSLWPCISSEQRRVLTITTTRGRKNAAEMKQRACPLSHCLSEPTWCLRHPQVSLFGIDFCRFLLALAKNASAAGCWGGSHEYTHTFYTDISCRNPETAIPSLAGCCNAAVGDLHAHASIQHGMQQILISQALNQYIFFSIHGFSYCKANVYY